VLEERGIDMHKVHISKAELALWGIERLTRLKKKKARAISAGKGKVSRTAGSIRRAIGHSDGVAVKDRQRHSTSEASSVGPPHSSSTTSRISHTHARYGPIHQTDFPADTKPSS